MKLIILLAVAALANGAKLDRTYLPPSYAQTSGGSGNFLQTPVSGSEQYQNGFAQNAAFNGAQSTGFNGAQNDDVYNQNNNGFAQSNDYAQSGDYAQNGNGFAQNDNGFAQNGNGFDNFEARPERAQAAFERNAAILRQDNTNDGETYAYAYETENGIVAEENGVATNGVEAQGGYSYTGDDGQVYSIRYTAGQNGFVPQGDHLPTPPPIPEEILKALEQNARDEASGIFDDGTYNEAKYGDAEQSQYSDNGNGYNYNNEGNNFNAGGDLNGNVNGNVNGGSFSDNGNDDDSVVTNNALIRSNNGFAQNGFNQNGFEKAYLPPQGQGSNPNGPIYDQTQNNLNNVRIGQRGQVRNGDFNQANGVQKAYLPPFGQRDQSNAQRQSNGQFNQRNGGLRNGSNGVEKAYLPPFSQNGVTGASFEPQNGFSNQAPISQGPRNQGFGSRNGANREYLPPSANQRTNGRRPSFNARNGYQY